MVQSLQTNGKEENHTDREPQPVMHVLRFLFGLFLQVLRFVKLYSCRRE